MPDASEQPGLAQPVEESVQALAAFHQDHYRNASRLQRGIDSLTGLIGRPTSALLVILGLVLWAVLAWRTSNGEVEAAPFIWLEMAGTMLALVVALLILVTQRREDQLAERRSKLVLELALLADKRTAKVIALLEELRRDAPGIADRIDSESDDMAQAADPADVLEAIETHTDKKAG